jgi:predicted transcriptional regulator
VAVERGGVRVALEQRPRDVWQVLEAVANVGVGPSFAAMKMTTMHINQHFNRDKLVLEAGEHGSHAQSPTDVVVLKIKLRECDGRWIGASKMQFTFT